MGNAECNLHTLRKRNVFMSLYKLIHYNSNKCISECVYMFFRGFNLLELRGIFNQKVEYIKEDDCRQQQSAWRIRRRDRGGGLGMGLEKNCRALCSSKSLFSLCIPSSHTYLPSSLTTVIQGKGKPTTFFVQ